MLGEILTGLTDPARAAEVLAQVARPEIAARVAEKAKADGLSEGALIASKIRHLMDHGTEDLWLDLVGVMSGSPQPAVAALAYVVSRAFPDPARVRVTRKTS